VVDRRLPTAGLLVGLLLLALISSGCGGADSGSAGAATTNTTTAAASCPAAWKPGWQHLADRIHAPVYCPSWMPDPLTGRIQGKESFGGVGGYVLSVSPDRSYLASFIWAEPGSGELHINLRGYPGRARIPRCESEDATGTKVVIHHVPCFADPAGTVHEGAIKATMYTVNQDADQWHILMAWHYRGSLYAASMHVAAPLNYTKVVQNLHHLLSTLVLVDPAS
jgi:hypothetical protein